MKWQDKRHTGELERKRPAKIGKITWLLMECVVALLIAAVVIYMAVVVIMIVAGHEPESG